MTKAHKADQILKCFSFSKKTLSQRTVEVKVWSAFRCQLIFHFQNAWLIWSQSQIVRREGGLKELVTSSNGSGFWKTSFGRCSCQWWLACNPCSQWKRTQMWPMQLFNIQKKPPEKTFDETQWRKTSQMQPMWLFIFSYSNSEKAHEDTHWWKAFPMQPMWLCVFPSIRSEDTYDNT